MRVGDLVRRSGGMGADGQLGRVVESDDGVLMVRLNRAAQEMLLPLREGEWTLAAEEQLTPMARAAVCYDADRRLQLTTGGGHSTKEWASLTDAARHLWMRGPPAGASELRLRLYRAIQEELQK